MMIFNIGDRVKFKDSIKKPMYSARPTRLGMTVVGRDLFDPEDPYIRCKYDELLNPGAVQFTQLTHPDDLEYEYVQLPYDPEQQGDRDDDI